MAEEVTDGVPFGEVAEILDATTLVVTGPICTDVSEGKHVVVVAIGGQVRNVGVPLVVPKMTLEVVNNLGLYIIVRPLVREYQEPGLADFTSQLQPHTVRRRANLPIADKDKSGNPAQEPIRLGDIVLRPENLRSFVEFLQTRNLERPG